MESEDVPGYSGNTGNVFNNKFHGKAEAAQSFFRATCVMIQAAVRAVDRRPRMQGQSRQEITAMTDLRLMTTDGQASGTRRS